jgi:hypothetical protein
VEYRKQNHESFKFIPDGEAQDLFQAVVDAEWQIRLVNTDERMNAWFS